jgi:hypothetical protein
MTISKREQHLARVLEAFAGWEPLPHVAVQTIAWLESLNDLEYDTMIRLEEAVTTQEDEAFKAQWSTFARTIWNAQGSCLQGAL